MKPILAAILLLSPAIASAEPVPPEPAIVRVRLETTAGPIVLALDTRRAPKSSANFLAYVDDERLNGTSFYRASRGRENPRLGFIQGGVGNDTRRKLPPVPFEPTSRTGLSHVDGAISMARGDDPDLASCNFSLMVGPHPNLDAGPRGLGYATFGRVVGDMGTVKRILAMPTGGGVGPMRGQMLFHPVTIIRAVRLDGTARPTGRAKPWLVKLPTRRPPRRP